MLYLPPFVANKSAITFPNFWWLNEWIGVREIWEETTVLDLLKTAATKINIENNQSRFPKMVEFP
jgi:hypothetical protein